MRIAYLCSDFGIPIDGHKGAAIHVREVCHALSSLGHEVILLTPRIDVAAPSTLAVEIRHLPPTAAETALFDHLRSDPVAGKVVANEIRSMLYSVSLTYRALPLLRDFRPDLLYERYALHATAGGQLAAALAIPWILEVNAPLSEEQAEHRGLAFSHTARATEQATLCSADHIVAVSGELRDWLVSRGVDPDRVLVLPNGVDVSRFAAPPDPHTTLHARQRANGAPIVGFVGSLRPWHGTATLIQAVAHLRRDSRPVHLLIVGDGPERLALEQLAQTSGVADVTTFVGAVPHHLIPSYLSVFDVAVAPYDRLPHFYFSPLKLFEYMAAARPLVAADVGQISALVQHGTTGCLYPPGDVPALAAAIRGLLDNPPLAQTIGRAARDYVSAHHTWQGIAREIVAVAAANRRLPVPNSG